MLKNDNGNKNRIGGQKKEKGNNIKDIKSIQRQNRKKIERK